MYIGVEARRDADLLKGELNGKRALRKPGFLDTRRRLT